MEKLGIKVMEINISERIYTPEYFSLLGKKIKGLKISQSLLAPKATTDLMFLQGIKDKAELKVLLVDVGLKNCLALNNLYLFDNLLELAIINSSAKPMILNLAKFPFLKHLSVIGSFELQGLEKIELESLNIIENRIPKFNVYSNTIKNLYLKNVKEFDFKNLMKLKKLTFTKCQLTSLDGIENLKELEELEINYCAKLIDIKTITHCSKLRKLELESNKNIESFNCLSNLKNLKGLILSNCGNVQSLKFINSMESLKFLSFVGTNIVDGDLTPCLRLEYVGTMDKRHYNLKVAELPNNKEFMFQRI